MITVHVKYYLDDAGKDYFEKTWLPTVLAAIKEQPGFISMDHKLAYKGPEEPVPCPYVKLEFATIEELTAWATTPIHEGLVRGLNRFRTAPGVYKWQPEGTDESTLEWLVDPSAVRTPAPSHESDMAPGGP